MKQPTNDNRIQLIKDYKFVFSSDEGKRILSDLEKRCHEFVTTHDKANSHETSFLEGQRSVLIFIKNHGGGSWKIKKFQLFKKRKIVLYGCSTD